MKIFFMDIILRLEVTMDQFIFTFFKHCLVLANFKPLSVDFRS